MHHVMQNGKTINVQLVLGFSANYQPSLFHNAARSENIKAIDLFLQYCNISISDGSSIYFTAKSKRMQFLPQGYASVQDIDNGSLSPLHVTPLLQDYAFVQYLLYGSFSPLQMTPLLQVHTSFQNLDDNTFASLYMTQSLQVDTFAQDLNNGSSFSPLHLTPLLPGNI